jgi:hypothetical protein
MISPEFMDLCFDCASDRSVVSSIKDLQKLKNKLSVGLAGSQQAVEAIRSHVVTLRESGAGRTMGVDFLEWQADLLEKVSAHVRASLADTYRRIATLIEEGK